MQKEYNANNPEVRFMRAYYKERLTFYEQIAFSEYTHNQLLEFGQEASSLHKYILDCYEEEYQDFIDKVAEPVNARERLQRFLQELITFLGEKSERDLFHLYPQVTDLPLLKGSHYSGEILALNEQLEILANQAQNPIDIKECFTDAEAMRQWKMKTTLILKEMSAFMTWTLEQWRRGHSDSVPVFLLRDTLFPYFGYSLLWRKGLLPRAPKPMLLNRKFLLYNGGNEETYETLLLHTIYQGLTLHPQDAAQLSKIFREIIHTKEIPPRSQQETRAYINRLAGSNPLFIIESGLHGSMPLWVLSQCDNHGSFVLYTSGPWLKKVYQANIFRHNYNYLRDIETSVLQNSLFQFHAIEDQNIFIVKTREPMIERLALYELHEFMQLLENDI